MHRRTGTRLTIAAGVAIGLSFSIAPQWVSGSTDTVDADTVDAGSGDARPAVVEIDDQVWPIDLHETTPARPAAPEAAVTEASTVVDTVEAPAPAPAPAPVTAPAPAPAAPAPDAPAVPAPDAPAAAVAAGTVHVDVAPVAGASRSVSLESADGSLVGGPVAVDGNRITFSDLADGPYDLYVEESSDEGGTFLTRTNLVVSGGELVVSCDAETLDCTVS